MAPHKKRNILKGTWPKEPGFDPGNCLAGAWLQVQAFKRAGGFPLHLSGAFLSYALLTLYTSTTRLHSLGTELRPAQLHDESHRQHLVAASGPAVREISVGVMLRGCRGQPADLWRPSGTDCRWTLG